MAETFNIYCDESCHLENDGQPAMVLGSVWCQLDNRREICVRLREIKQQHRLDPGFEIKWTKVSPSKIGFYMDVVDYFFDEDDLHFRALIVPDKGELKHSRFQQSHDDWYYKMYFDLLKAILTPNDRYRIYLDVKDTRGGRKVAKLHEVLSNSVYDFSQQIVERIQLVRSHEVELLPLADLLIGAVSYVNRGLSGNKAKERLVARIRERSRYSLTQTTLFREKKVNGSRTHASKTAQRI